MNILYFKNYLEVKDLTLPSGKEIQYYSFKVDDKNSFICLTFIKLLYSNYGKINKKLDYLFEEVLSAYLLVMEKTEVTNVTNLKEIEMVEKTEIKREILPEITLPNIDSFNSDSINERLNEWDYEDVSFYGSLILEEYIDVMLSLN